MLELLHETFLFLIGPEPLAVVYEFDDYVMMVLAWIW
jgi:hypothetical protein